jgi:hypothetical protein
LLSTVDAMLTVSRADCVIVRSSLFKIGVTVLALAHEQHLKDEARGAYLDFLTESAMDFTLF